MFLCMHFSLQHMRVPWRLQVQTASTQRYRCPLLRPIPFLCPIRHACYKIRHVQDQKPEQQIRNQQSEIRNQNQSQSIGNQSRKAPVAHTYAQKSASFPALGCYFTHKKCYRTNAGQTQYKPPTAAPDKGTRCMHLARPPKTRHPCTRHR